MPVDIPSKYADNHPYRNLYAEETEKVSQERLLTLVELIPPSIISSTSLYFVDNNTEVVYGGISYVPFPIKLQGISTTTEGSIDKTSLTVGNVDRTIMYFVEQYNGLSKWRVKIKFVYEKFIDSGAFPDDLAYIEEEFLIDTYTANEQYVSFSLEPIIDLSIQLPRRRFMTDSCFWRYKDADTCKYSGAVAGDCKKTLEDCKARNNQLNFGGFPGVSGQRRLYI